MPLGCRNIEPSRLGAHEVPVDGESDRRTVLYTVANNAIVGTLLQLASLVRHADDLFCDIADECQKVLDRTDSISKRIQGLDATISKLDAKQAIIPEGDLKQFTAVTHHHEARHGYDANFFIPTNRPQCVLDLYALCLPNPTRVIRSADLYRKDGLSGSKMFKCWPVLINEKRVRTPDLNLTRSIQRVRSFEKKYKQPRARPKTIHGFDDFNFEEMKKGAVDQHKSAQCLTSPEPPVIVTIDTSGSNFERMQSLRSSGRLQLSTEEKEKRKKRRRTVSGLQNIMGEIEKFDRKKKTAEGQSRTTPRSYSFDDLDDEDEVERDEGLMKYLDEIDGKMEERTGEEKAQKLLNFFCGRRSKSLPRCIKLPSVSRSLSADRRSVKDLNTTYGSSSLSIQSLTSNASSRLSRSAKRSSIIGNKIKSLVTGQKDKPKPRPKSLDIDTLLDTKAKHKSSIEEHERSKSTYSLERKHLLTVPDNLLKKESSSKSSSTLGPGSYYNFESNTLPRATAKKYDFPWETLPKDWTTSVKLREISKRRAKEDRQSSSGNWSQSGTSSNRHSLDSDLRSEEPNKFQSQYSLGKDSGRDSLTLEEENDCVTDGTSTAGYAGDTQSTITGDSVSIGNPKTDFTQLDTEAWIKSLAVRAAQKEAESADKSSSLSRLTRQNILALDLMLAEASPKKKIDDESSVYSVDQEGFYTSFHNDSGLKRSTNTLIDEDEDDACLTPCKDTLSIGSEDSVIHRSALSDKFAGLRRGGNRKKVLSKVTPPLPPDRNLFDSNSQGFDNQTNKPELNSFPSVESSTESEEAVFTRVHDKTNLTHTGFPSLVALSTSDDESSPETKSAGLNSQGLESSVLQHTRSDLGLSNITCASNFSHVSLQSGSYLDDRTHSSPSLKHSSSVLECSKQGCDSPQTGRKEKSKVESSYQSWPRSHKSHTGILKSSEKSVESSRPCKTLNFDPVINLFKEGYQDAVQIPLPSPTNSSASESGRLSSFNLSEQSYSLAVPINERTKNKSNRQSDLPLKYQPVITVTPRSRSRSGDRKTFNSNVIADSSNTKSGQPQRPVIYATASKPRAQSTPQVLTNGSSTATTSAAPNLYAVSPVMAPREPCRQNSTSSKSSETSLYMDMQSLKSADSVDSLTSSECLNFNDTNNYMTMSSPSVSPNLSNMDFSITSTPSGSLDSLLDLRKTPTNELENDTYQINTNLHSSRSNGYMADFGNNKCVGDAKTIASSSYISDNKQNIGASSSLKYTPGRRSVDSSDGDLTQVTQISMNSTMDGSRTPGSGNMMPGMQTRTPVSQHSASSEVSSAGNPSRQIGRRGSRADTRKEPSYRDLNAASRRSLPTDVAYHVRHVPLNDTKQGAPANQTHSPSMSSSKSFPLGFNSVLVSNSSYSSGQKGANNSSRPNVPQQSPSAYSQGDQFSSRSDSYRVAMGNGNQRTVSYRNAMHSSKSFPVLPPTTQSGPYRVAMDMNPSMAANNTCSYDDDVLNRADSYRMAVRNTNGIVSDVGNRNSALRVALHEDIPSHVNSKLEALGMEDSGLMSGRDVRRRGITDVDQVKNIKGKPAMKTSKSMPQMRTQDSKSPSAVVTRRKQEPTRQPAVTPETRPQSGRIRKVTTQDVDPIEIVQTVDTSVDSRKSAKNNPNRSSTYIQFDAIFEDGEDFTNPGDMDLSSLDYSKNLSSTSKSKIGLFNGTMKDANANNVKPTVFGTSKAGKNMEVEDNWRFSQV